MSTSQLEALLSIARDAVPASKRNLRPDFPWEVVTTLAAHLADGNLKPTHANLLIVAKLVEIDLSQHNLATISKALPPIIAKITSG